MSKLKMAKGRQVKVFDPELVRRREENKKYLLELENENLLLPYTLEAGLYKTSELPPGIHGGWESPVCELRGHFLGHWLSAAAMHYEATGNEMVKAKADEIVDILEKCQKENGGRWAASIPEKYFYWIGNKKRIWAPQYTVHKTFMGLLDMYELAGNEKALEIAVHFGEWFYDWSGRYTKEQFQGILDVETGGMLEIWVLLYRITKKGLFRELMDRYYRCDLFDGLLEGRDVLTNMHANTTIPEILGAAAAYEATGEEKWLDMVKAYWDMAVTRRGTYATGGQTCGEIWSPRMHLAYRLGDKNQEHCTVYNMMRLADFLFRCTGDAVYMDYWERNLYNGIMAQGYWRGSRVPWWMQGTPVFLVDGKAVDLRAEKGSFAEIKRVWKQNTIHVEIPKGIHADYLPGRPDMAAFLDGPVVLAGLCGEERTLYVDPREPEQVLVSDNEREWAYWQNTYKTIGQDTGIRFVPLHQVGYEEYQIYFPLKGKNHDSPLEK